MAPTALTDPEEALAELARRKVGTATDLTYYFVCCGNESVVRSFYELLRVVAPAHGGFAAMHGADRATIEAHRAEAGNLAFSGRKRLIREVTEVATVADALSTLGATAPQHVFSAVAGVGPEGRDQVEQMYRRLVSQSFRQGIMPFPMLETTDRKAASRLLEGCRKIAGDDLPGEPIGRHRG